MRASLIRRNRPYTRFGFRVEGLGGLPSGVCLGSGHSQVVKCLLWLYFVGMYSFLATLWELASHRRLGGLGILLSSFMIRAYGYCNLELRLGISL